VLTQPWSTLFGVAVGLGLVWVALLIALAAARPKDMNVTDALRLLPDTVVLLRRLAADPQLPQGVRVRLVLLLLYLILPIDLVPDFIPVLGYADDAVIVAAALRSVARRAGPEASTNIGPAPPLGSTPSDDSPASRDHPRTEVSQRITTERSTSPWCIRSKAASTSSSLISSVTNASRSSRPCR
jgi:uncharacterized membrane protein YkvA (DUF1232 family)